MLQDLTISAREKLFKLQFLTGINLHIPESPGFQIRSFQTTPKTTDQHFKNSNKRKVLQSEFLEQDWWVSLPQVYRSDIILTSTKQKTKTQIPRFIQIISRDHSGEDFRSELIISAPNPKWKTTYTLWPSTTNQQSKLQYQNIIRVRQSKQTSNHAHAMP